MSDKSLQILTALSKEDTTENNEAIDAILDSTPGLVILNRYRGRIRKDLTDTAEAHRQPYLVRTRTEI